MSDYEIDLPVHEAADLFPLEYETMRELADDIAQHGQRESIKLLAGEILDGRRRYLACQMADVEPRFEDVATDDPWGYVASLNIHRRNLTMEQRKELGLRLAEQYRASSAGGFGDKCHRSNGVCAPKLDRSNGGRLIERAAKAVGIGKSTLYAEQQKRRAAAAPKPEAANRPAAFDKLALFNRVNDTCNELGRVAKELADDVDTAVYFDWSQFQGHLHSLKELVKYARPHAVCPTCNGDRVGDGTCTCKGCGWVNKSRCEQVEKWTI